jgi:hypothetical protein
MERVRFVPHVALVISSTIAATTCNACLPGTYQDSTGILIFVTYCCLLFVLCCIGGTVCKSCIAGSISTSIGSSQCSSCPFGSYSNGIECIDCDDGWAPTADYTNCTECLPGYFAGSGAPQCTKCSTGRFSLESGATECTICPTGGDVTICCPFGSIVDTVAGDASCIPCGPGTKAVVDACISCEVGHVLNV